MYGFTVRLVFIVFFVNSFVKGKYRRGVGGCLFEVYGQFGKEFDFFYGGIVCYFCCLLEIKSLLVLSYLCICSKFEISFGNGERDVYFFFFRDKFKIVQEYIIE